MESYDLDEASKELKAAFGEANVKDRDVLSHALYPAVFKEWQTFKKIYGDLEYLPTHTFLRPMRVGEEFSFKSETGRRIFLSLESISDVDESGSRMVVFEVNGERWFIRTTDETPSLVTGGGPVKREKVDSFSPGHIGAPMPGVVVDVKVKEGNVIQAGEPLFVLSAMKMETSIKAPISGTVKRVLINMGDKIEADDLMADIEP